ncbi:MAG: hypothetical protein COW65_15950 [Cytophagales bacterium CG18_big_fil_WC_8_21_14_2_50_42_9]|nr:MAG: hypothetical protein COW65_15950 [Cytophagales bacterium CG18_big_fil_WC_8_21_14_2_50_42_9]
MPYLPQLKVIFLDEFLKISCDETIRLIYLEWLQHPVSEAFRPRFQKATELAKEKNIQYWLSDSQAIHYLELADQNWLVQEFKLILSHSNMKKFARVTTIESFSLVDMSQTFNRFNNGLDKLKVEFEEFLDNQEAMNWILADVDQAANAANSFRN